MSMNGRLLRPKASAAAAAPVPWYLSGGISAANCLGAYTGKGAASLAASLVNLNNPGTRDLIPDPNFPTRLPDWDAGTGWTFVGANSDTLLIPALTINQDTSIVVRYASFSVYLFKMQIDSPAAYFGIGAADGFTWGANEWGPGTYSSGVAAIIGNTAYDGLTLRKTFTDATWSASSAIGLSCRWRNKTNNDAAGNSVILALAVYNTRLTSDQYTALHAAMAAL